jgi:glucose-1-phosphate cytidylyltransferase
MGHVIHDWVENLKSNWSVVALDTGADSMTGGRIRQCLEYIGEEKVFATYGDGLGNVNLKKLLLFHNHQKRAATVTAVRPPARFGVLESSNGLVTHFGEKRQADAGWINGGFFVLEPEVKKFILSDSEPFETGALPRMVNLQELSAYEHPDFWQPMDTLREKNLLSEMANMTTPPWLKI